MDRWGQSFWRIGLIGFSYPEWSTTLYSDHAGSGRRGGHRLARYAEHFNCVEINTSFYGIPTLETVRSWAAETPAEFRFCIKMIRDVTHGPTPPGALASSTGPPPGHLLQESTLATARRLLDALEPLEGRIGSVLLQFPLKFAAERRDELATFLDRLRSAAPLAVELRNKSWWTPETDALLAAQGVCFVGADESPRVIAATAPDEAAGGGRPFRVPAPTTDFLYLRWLGKHGQFKDRTREHFDPTERLRWWAAALRSLAEQHPSIKTVYGFFDNDFAGHAPVTARRFLNLLGVPPRTPEVSGGGEPTLFEP